MLDRHNVVSNPSHYTDGNIEVIDFITDKHLSFSLGNVIKYVSRAGKKYKEKTIEDLLKAAWYLNHGIFELAKDHPELINEVCTGFNQQANDLEKLKTKLLRRKDKPSAIKFGHLFLDKIFKIKSCL